MKWITADTGTAETEPAVSILASDAGSENTAVFAAETVKEAVANRGPVFQDVLFRYIDEKQLKDSDVYHAAGIDRKYFSKIRTRREYVPKKNTVMALGIALHLELCEFEYLLQSAGYALMPSDKTDCIIRYCLEHHISDLSYINEQIHRYTGTTL